MSPECHERPAVHALVPAAGEGRRMGGSAPKQYLDLAGRPVLAHTLARLASHPDIRSLVVALAADDDRFARLELDLPCPLVRVTGGASRAESVLSGLHHLQEHDPTAWVLVHDAVRPCLPRACLDRLLAEGLVHSSGAILALPVRDTLKRADGDRVISTTIDRTGLWAAQTPQLFPVATLARALEACLADGVAPTDEASAMEYQGYQPRLVEGSPVNLKLTWPADVAPAAAWLTGPGMAE